MHIRHATFATRLERILALPPAHHATSGVGRARLLSSRSAIARAKATVIKRHAHAHAPSHITLCHAARQELALLFIQKKGSLRRGSLQYHQLMQARTRHVPCGGGKQPVWLHPKQTMQWFQAQEPAQSSPSHHWCLACCQHLKMLHQIVCNRATLSV